MNKLCVFAPVAGAMALAGSALAGPVTTEGPISVQILDLGAPGGALTYQIIADLGSSDQLLGVSAGASGMTFDSTAALINDDAGAFAGLVSGDLPAGAPFMSAWDTFVGIGDSTFPTDSQLAPGFLGGDGVSSVINGASFSEAAGGGGWFDSNPGTADGLGGGLFASLTLPADAQWFFEGELGFSTGEGGGLGAAYFSVLVPAPGAMALLGLAGLVGTRRRRG